MRAPNELGRAAEMLRDLARALEGRPEQHLATTALAIVEREGGRPLYERAVEAYLAGESPRQIVRRLGMSTKTLYNAIALHGIDLRVEAYTDAARQRGEEAAQLYAGGMDQKAAAAAARCGTATLIRALQAKGIPIRRRRNGVVRPSYVPLGKAPSTLRSSPLTPEETVQALDMAIRGGRLVGAIAQELCAPVAFVRKALENVPKEIADSMRSATSAWAYRDAKGEALRALRRKKVA